MNQSTKFTSTDPNTWTVKQVWERYYKYDREERRIPFLKRLTNPSKEVLRALLQLRGTYLRIFKDCPNMDNELRTIAVESDPWALEYIDNPTFNQKLIAVTKEPATIQLMLFPEPTLQEIACERIPGVIHYINPPDCIIPELIEKYKTGDRSFWPGMPGSKLEKFLNKITNE